MEHHEDSHHHCASVSSDLKALYKSVIIVIIITYTSAPEVDLSSRQKLQNGNSYLQSVDGSELLVWPCRQLPVEPGSAQSHHNTSSLTSRTIAIDSFEVQLHCRRYKSPKLFKTENTTINFFVFLSFLDWCISWCHVVDVHRGRPTLIGAVNGVKPLYLQFQHLAGCSPVMESL